MNQLKVFENPMFSKTPKVTGKGQQYFINKFIGQEQ